ncbi:GM13841 [Drosophila sechellia]|uniref:GM13841 n=1 Tax=Drosophila sechellia TaxID=7238 RepID=B4HUT9_DROSE|nr:GM13841 [Drosophila sechellia]
MTALQGVPLEFLPEQLLAIIWSAARAVSPGITALPLEKRSSPVGLGLGLGSGTHFSTIAGPATKNCKKRTSKQAKPGENPNPFTMRQTED